MKSLILIISLLVFSIADAKAGWNDTLPAKMDFGVLTGDNTTSILGYDGKVNIGSNNYYLVGIAGQYNFNQEISIKGEIDFEKKGFVEMHRLNISKQYPDLLSFNYTNLDYIEVPLLVKVKFGPSKRFFANTGPYLGYLLGGQSTLSTLDSLGDWNANTSNSYNNYKRFDLGAIAGIGAEATVFHKFIVSMEARSSFGFLNVGFPEGGKNYSLALLLSLRYVII